jgi:adenylosuccinate synthase
LKFACMINGVTSMVMTKADVLDTFAELQLCTGYKIGGVVVDAVPFQMTRVGIDPEYKKKAGWNTSTANKVSAADLPGEMMDYVDFINKFVGAPITYISNGPGREQIVEL